MPSNVEQIKDRLGIVDVVSQYIKLEKAGSNLKAKCPFHNEKTPSFMVSPARNTYYCFGCGVKGDIFTFVEQFEGLDFMGALKVLGDRVGVEIVFEKTESKDERAKLYEILEEATAFFEKNLTTHKQVVEYLKDRGLEKKTIVSWRLGYVSATWDSLYIHLHNRGFIDTDIEKAGLIKKQEKSDATYYDRFRGRIMFPLSDSSGRIIAFSGRIFKDDDKSALLRPRYAKASQGKQGFAEQAKYINSPETPLFNKSKVLYGYDRAKLTIRRTNFSIIVEGQIDLLMSHQAGYGNTVALSGTALTGEQLTLLKRLSDNIVMAFDSDTAGIASSGKGAELALSMGMDVKVAALPSGTDPAEVVKNGVGKWKEVVRKSKHIVDFYLDVLKESISDKRKLRLEIQRVVLPYVALIANKIDQAHFVSRTAWCLGISEEPIWEEIRKIPATTHTLPDTGVMNKKVVSTRKTTIEKTLIQILLWQKKLKKPSIDTTILMKQCIKIVGDETYKRILVEHGSVDDEILFTVEQSLDDEQDLKNEVQDLLLNLKKENTEEACREALGVLQEAEIGGNSAKTEQAEKKYKKVSDKLEKIKQDITQ